MRVLQHVVTVDRESAFEVASRVREVHLQKLEWAGLTRRQAEVALEVSLGLTNQQIADFLFLSLATVKGHVSDILALWAIDNRVQLAVRALREMGRLT